MLEPIFDRTGGGDCRVTVTGMRVEDGWALSDRSKRERESNIRRSQLTERKKEETNGPHAEVDKNCSFHCLDW